MKESQNCIPLIGYSDRLSVRPNEIISFKVSSENKSPFTASLFKSISADPNPEGLGILENSAQKHFPTQTFHSRKQSHIPGSYAYSSNKIKLETNTGFEISVNIYNTLKKNSSQVILNINNLILYINKNDKLTLKFNDTIISNSISIKLRTWYKLECGFDVLSGTIYLSQSIIKHSKLIDNNIEKIPFKFSKEIDGLIYIGVSYLNTEFINYFNGKIENPKIFLQSKDGFLSSLVEWDFSKGISTNSIPSNKISNLDLKLINYPMRAVTGSNWNGTEMSWKHAPYQYCAIHFHEDDIYDFKWENDFSFTIPSDMPNGIYIMRLRCEEYEDAITFFVCPPKHTQASKLCVIIPTFTYVIYGNHARPDYKKSWDKRITNWGAYKYNPANYQHYGLSTYNFHSDGSGISHASHLRPLLNLRPGYLTFGSSECSGLRHFQADSHLFSWLNNKNISYDILTDLELHNEGYDVLKNYQTVMTTTHPEYHTNETLNVFHDYRDNGGNLIYLGGNGFYWKICLHQENDGIIEIRRAEDGIRAWASEPGEYYNAFDGSYGGLWRRNGRPPQSLTGVGFSAQGQFTGSYYKRSNYSKENEWIFKGINEDKLGNFGFSGGGAAGFELDRVDFKLGTPENCTVLATSEGHGDDYVLVPEEHLTHLTTLPGEPLKKLLRADMVYFQLPNGGKVFSTGSITFCGSLPFNKFENNISKVLENVINNFIK